MAKIFGHPIQRPLLVLICVECLLLIASIELGAAFRLQIAGLEPWSMSLSFGTISTFVATCLISMVAFGLYESECCRDLKLSSLRLIVAFAAAFMFLAVIFYVIPDLAIWRSIAFYSISLAFFAVLSARFFFVRVADLERFKRPVLVLGAGEEAARIGRLAENTASRSFRILTYVKMSDDCPQVERFINVGDWPDVTTIAAHYGAQEIIVALSERRGLPINDLLKCRVAGLSVWDLASFLERETGRLHLDVMQPSWLVFADGFGVAQGFNRVLKRVFDVLSSAFVISFTLWLMVPVAIAIKLSSTGPIFYLQQRVGKNGKTFLLYKFRSMVADAEDASGPQWAQDGDPRITPVGRFIRATRIDELPQVINVLRGDMSFVGPRPERPYFVEKLREDIPLFDERHIVKPGITGWAQINYPYGASVDDARCKLEFDLYYVKNFSVLLDLAILIQTVKVVVWQNGVR